MNFKADSNQTNKCGHCGATENLMKCTKCSAAAYCSKKCQVSDWPEHKFLCKVISKVESKTNEVDAIGSVYKLAQKEGQVLKLMMTHAGTFHSSTKEMPAGVPENFLFIHEAASKMAMLGEDKRMYGEREYKRLYDDLVFNEHEWMEFFEHFLNNSHAGDCTMVLELLLSIYYERGDYESCGQVLDMHAKVLHFCKKHGVQKDQLAQFCKWTEYRTKQIRYQMNLILKHHARNVALFRELCQFEMTNDPATNQYLYLYKRWKKMYRKRKSLHDLTDAMILEVIKVHSLELCALKVDSARVQLHECALCKEKETSLGEFMNCSRCKKVAYCGRTCQKKHWKIHKSNCKAAPGGK